MIKYPFSFNLQECMTWWQNGQETTTRHRDTIAPWSISAS
jgi:hypothetical protein